MMNTVSDYARLKIKLVYCQDRLARITNHPYVKLGFKVQSMVHKIRRALEYVSG